MTAEAVIPFVGPGGDNPDFQGQPTPPLENPTITGDRAELADAD